MSGKKHVHQVERDRVLVQLRSIDEQFGLTGADFTAAAADSGYSARQLRRLLSAETQTPVPAFALTETIIDELLLCCGNIAKTHRRLQRKGVAVPSLRTFGRVIIRDAGLTRRTAAGGLRGLRSSRISLAAPDHEVGEELLSDHTELPCWVLAPGTSTRVVRPWATVVMDHNTRYALSLVITYGRPGAEEVAAAIASAMYARLAPDGQTLVGGRPSRIAWDQGKEFLADRITESTDRVRVKAVALPAFMPHLKGRLERFWDFMKSDALSTLPGYAEKDGPVDLRGQALYRSTALTAEAFEAELTRWLDYYNSEHVNTAMGCTAVQAWNKRTTPVDVIPPAQLALDFMIAKQKHIVGHEGVHFRGRKYLDPNNSLEFGSLIGQKVEIRYLTNDLTFIEVFHNGRHVCSAVDRAGLRPEQIETFLSARFQVQHDISKQVSSANRLRNDRDDSVKTKKTRSGRGLAVPRPDTNLLASGDPDWEAIIGSLPTGPEQLDLLSQDLP